MSTSRNSARIAADLRQRRYATRERLDGRWVAVEATDHGLSSTYTNWGCRCESCVKAHNAEQARQRAARTHRRVLVDGRWVAPVPTAQHGSMSTYTNWGCRCVDCTQANLLHAQRYRGLA